MAKNSETLIHLNENQFLFLQEDVETSLYKLQSGKLLAFVTDKSKVTPLGEIGPGEFIGEMGFFDGIARSAHILALESSSLIKISIGKQDRYFPPWLTTIGESLTKRLRELDRRLAQKGIRDHKDHSHRPLSIERQRQLFLLVEREHSLRR